MISRNDGFETMIGLVVESAVRKALSNGETATRRLLTVEETAVYLSLSERQIQNMISARSLPVVRQGRRVMVDIRDLDRWIEDNKA
jgi:excisionase family DNA binding protein